jgi:hypothetical protein
MHGGRFELLVAPRGCRLIIAYQAILMRAPFLDRRPKHAKQSHMREALLLSPAELKSLQNSINLICGLNIYIKYQNGGDRVG